MHGPAALHTALEGPAVLHTALDGPAAIAAIRMGVGCKTVDMLFFIKILTNLVFDLIRSKFIVHILASQHFGREPNSPSIRPVKPSP